MKRTGKISLWGGTALIMDPSESIVENALIEIENGEIVSVCSQKVPRKPKGESLDCRDCLVIPGLINTHTHTGMTMLRGIADDLPFEAWLFDRIFPLEKRWGNSDFVYWGTMLACAEMIRGGTTLFNDMYYFEESAAKAVHECGMRAVCGQTIVDISGVEKAEDIIGKFDTYLEIVRKYPKVIPGIAPHSIYGVSEAAWPKVIEYARKQDLLIHVHLCETEGEVQDALKRFKRTPTEVFKDLGLWSYPQVIAAHAVCLTDKDIRILGEHHVGVAHNPQSNLKLGNKICPVVELREAGVSVGIGTDSTASNNDLDLFSEVDTAAKLQIFRKGIGKLTAYDCMRMLTIEGANALGLGAKTGSLEVGKWADIAVVSTRAPHAQPIYDPYSFLVYSAKSTDVIHTVVGGEVLMRDRKIESFPEEKVLDEARRWGAKILAGIA